MSPSVPVTYRASARVRARTFDGELVLLDLERDLQYAMNEIGAHVWAQATSGADADAIVRTLTGAYEVDAVEARADVGRILGELVASGLLVQVEAGEGAGPG